jgi:hypothetical protein
MYPSMCGTRHCGTGLRLVGSTVWLIKGKFQPRTDYEAPEGRRGGGRCIVLPFL